MYQRKGFPSKNDLVMCTVQKVAEPTVFLSLEEYSNLEGALHTTEIERKWVRKLKSKLKPGTKLVCQVLRVDQRDNHISLSQRNVSESQSRKKQQEWANEKTADSMLTFFAKENKNTKAYEEILDYLLGAYGFLYPVFLRIVSGDEKVLEDAKIDKKTIQKFIEFIKGRLLLPVKKITYDLNMTSSAGNGLDYIQETIKKIKSFASNKAKIEVSYIGAPKYKVELSGTDAKALESAYDKLSGEVESYLRKHEGEAKFARQNVRHKKDK